ncbi:CPBP family intramembrane glutamic endopeptidase [Gracilibacillus sp. YIM 98692]|uniref:CPBP family intramembrane glutamic endopeptidase n=1 Tax=Gracilibacillus sp. YIM 98692 TaxID=2663532 RepID=UPI0013D3780B|nr:CPBP family intramembrane glutamic endopeptidase [Gracilibacillus sp. YIM 98692]
MKDNTSIIDLFTSQQLKQQVWISQFILLVISCILGFLFLNSFSDLYVFFQWDWRTIFLYGGSSVVLIVILDLLFMYYFPRRYWDDGGINHKLFSEGSYLEIVFLCLFVAIIEEVLFRGIIQSTFGIFLASIVFALIHFRYLRKLWLFLSILVISFGLGILFEWTNNLFVVIFVHFFNNATLAMLIRTGRIWNERKTSITS